jgi:hypothetical protein
VGVIWVEIKDNSGKLKLELELGLSLALLHNLMATALALLVQILSWDQKPNQ